MEEAKVSDIAVETTTGNKMVLKAIEISNSKSDRGLSRAMLPDAFFSDYGIDVIEPPLNLYILATLQEASSILGPCFDAMAINIEGLGYRIIPRDGISYEGRELASTIESEISMVDNFFANSVLETTLTKFRDVLRRDYESTGNAYIEVLPSFINPGEPGGMNHIPSWTMRVGKLDDEHTSYIVKRASRVTKDKWTIQEFPTKKRFRRFVQRCDGGNTKSYFKEWGDPRVINYQTGEVLADSWDSATDEQRNLAANQIIHLKLYCPRSPYGLPRFIGNLFTIYGTREAEKINYMTLKCNNIPALLMMVTNAQLTSGSINRIKTFVEERVQGDNNYSTILIVEAEPISEGMKDVGSMKMEVKQLQESQHTDAMFVNYMDKNDEKVRQAFRLPPIFLGRCVSIDTEFLTENGWKHFDDIVASEKIATINSTSGMLEFQTPLSSHKYDYDGQMFRFNNHKAIDALVTPNHRMMYRWKDKAWNFKQAYEIPSWHIEFLLSSLEWQGEEVETYRIEREPSMIETGLYKSHNKTRDFERAIRYESRHEEIGQYRMDDFLEFVGYFISEGYTSKTRGPISISQNSGEVLEKIKNVVDRMGLHHSDDFGSNRPEQINVNLCYVPLWQWLRENCGVGSANKTIPREFLNLPRRQLHILYTALMDGDGYWSDRGRENSGTYTTTSKLLADTFQELCFRLGYRSSMRIDDRQEFGWKDIYVITVSSESTNHMMNVDKCIELVRYTGEVCCFTTPNSTIVTRRNGRILVSGNSDDYNRSTADSSRKLAEEQVFRPERDSVDDVFNTTIVPALGAASVVFRSNTPNVTDNYELTQLLAVAERSGGLSPHISRLVVEDVLGRDLPEVDPEINPHVPFTLTMLREQLNAQAAIAGQTSTTKNFSDQEIIDQLKTVKSLMMTSSDTSPEATEKMSKLISLLEMTKVDVPVITSGVSKTRKFTQVIKAAEEHIVGGAVLVPGAVDLQGDTYSEESVVDAARYWMQIYGDSDECGIKLMHKGKIIKNAARAIESYTLTKEEEFVIDASAAGDDHPSKEISSITYPKGTWMLYARIIDQALWDAMKDGTYIGWSIGGVATVEELKRLRLGK